MRSRTRSLEETREYGERLAAELAPDGVLLLHGDLGAGKTVLAQGVARGLGIDPRGVVSPTFTLIQEYHGEGGDLVHVDLYRLAPDEVWELGLEELFAGPGVKVVEWPERLPFDLPQARRVEIRVAGDPQSRDILEAVGGAGDRSLNHHGSD